MLVNREPIPLFPRHSQSPPTTLRLKDERQSHTQPSSPLAHLDEKLAPLDHWGKEIWMPAARTQYRLLVPLEADPLIGFSRLQWTEGPPQGTGTKSGVIELEEEVLALIGYRFAKTLPSWTTVSAWEVGESINPPDRTRSFRLPPTGAPSLPGQREASEAPPLFERSYRLYPPAPPSTRADWEEYIVPPPSAQTLQTAIMGKANPCSTRKKRASRSRSKAGCYTCRVRHKACAGERPTCGACLRLGLPCDYSTQRPAYMVSTYLQETKLEEIKAITKRRKVTLRGRKK